MPRHLINDAHEWINEIPTACQIVFRDFSEPFTSAGLGVSNRPTGWRSNTSRKSLTSISNTFARRPVN